MTNSLYGNIFFMLGGIAIMMFGMKFMGSNLEQVAGNNMKKMLGKLTSNRFAGVGVGTAVTAIINSSTATTVMLVGFVNIGLMSLSQATSVIMGANIGTTVTAQILSLSGSDGVDINAIAAIIAAVGMVITITAKKDKYKKIGSIFIGLGMIFIGLKIMSKSVHSIIYDGETLKPAFKTIFQNENIFPLLLILIGIVFTALIQSSAAITGILIALGSAINFRTAVFIILGSNIGTCITSIISSIGTSTNAKRTAVIHLLFNLFGCLICIVPIWVFTSEIESFMVTISGNNMQRIIANFHTIFNIGTTIILLPFTDILVKITKCIIPEEQTANDTKHRLTFVDDRLLETPAIAVGNLKNEIIKMGAIARENINFAMEMLLDDNVNKKEEIKDNENALNYLSRQLTEYLTKLSGKELSLQDELKVGSYYHVVSDVERIGDYAENIMEYSDRLRADELNMSEEAKKELQGMIEDVNKLFAVSVETLDRRDLSLLSTVDTYEEKIDEENFRLENMHIERLKKGLCSAQIGSIYLQTISNLERVGDHITNIAYSVKKYQKPRKFNKK